MKKWKRKTTSMQKAYTRTHQGYYSLSCDSGTFSPSVVDVSAQSAYT
jgi:hypothetical protein